MKKKPASAHTIGYEQIDFARFAERLAAAGIDLILDVRAVPVGRKPGFSETASGGILGDGAGGVQARCPLGRAARVAG